MSRLLGVGCGESHARQWVTEVRVTGWVMDQAATVDRWEGEWDTKGDWRR